MGKRRGYLPSSLATMRTWLGMSIVSRNMRGSTGPCTYYERGGVHKASQKEGGE